MSSCHRQDIPSERQKLEKDYVAPIYCKFVNRSVVHAILRKRHLLKNIRNEVNQPYFIKTNLTPTRRLLWDSVEKKLGHYKFKWVTKKGDIFVRENSRSKAIKVVSDRNIEELEKKEKQSLLSDVLRENEEPSLPSPPATKEMSPRHTKDKGLHQNAHHSRRPPVRNYYSDIASSNYFPPYMGSSLNFTSNIPQFPPLTSNYSKPYSTFKNKSLFNYRSSPFQPTFTCT